jgi:hypothetical protein
MTYNVPEVYGVNAVFYEGKDLILEVFMILMAQEGAITSFLEETKAG